MRADEVNQQVEQLARELRRADLPPLLAAQDTTVLATIGQAIAPLRLPAWVRRFWELVDPESIAIHAHPRLTSPKFGLETWTMHVSEMVGMCPRVLFPLAYESHCHLLVELDGPDQEDGGAIFSWAYAGAPFRLVFTDIGEYTEHLRRALVDGRFQRSGDTEALIEGESLVDAAPGTPVHPTFGAISTIEEEVDDWPEAWRLSEGITPERSAPVGATRSISELLLEAQFETIEARVIGTVTELAGADGLQVTITDGEDSMRIWCPAGISPFGPVLSETFEFHVTAPASDVPEPPDFTPLGGDATLAQLSVDINSISDRLTAAHRPVDATASDIRRA